MSEIKQCIIIRTDLKMQKGKIAVQAAHASIAAFIKAKRKEPELTEKWLNSGMQKSILKIDSKEELVMLFEEVKKRYPSSLIKDAGRTQIPAGTITAVGIGPALESDLDKITGKLKLL